MSCWLVYEVAKRMYMATGHVPTLEQLQAEFEGLPVSKVEEGMEHFHKMIGG